MSKQPFRFLDLPPEIREKIYIQISTSPTAYIHLNAPNAHGSFPSTSSSPMSQMLAVLMLLPEIYHELRPIYFTVNPISVTLLRHNESWSYFLSPSWEDNRREIRNLRLNIVRWGTKDFFTNRLLPILEDCILNGKLRDLEVRTRSGWMKSMDAGPGHSGLIGNTNWRPLGALLRDPYLESGVLMAGPASRVEVSGQTHDGSLSDLDSISTGEPFRDVQWVFDIENDIWRAIPDEEQRRIKDST
ncbi:hypothetical protein D0Z07_2013 [Hyphodiscus hymeniophilus]|uniref:Uncharacterized protein n=1 Tax=Hyphodiscus hymeniophilus TaxID=353542 RepID=A0A9P6VNW4_9HELO|nr:hypothetical protein D0Z07_2013 [Hyphodiscus hymeniophilus]